MVFQFQGQAQIVVQSRIIGRAFQCGLKLCNRGIEIALLQIRGAQVGAIASVIRTKTKRCLESRNGAGGVSHLDQGQPEIIVRIGIVGIDFHGMTKCRDGRLSVTRTLQQQAELGLGLGEIRLQLDRSAKFFDGLVRARHAARSLPARVRDSSGPARFAERVRPFLQQAESLSICFCCQRTTPRCKVACAKSGCRRRASEN